MARGPIAIPPKAVQSPMMCRTSNKYYMGKSSSVVYNSSNDNITNDNNNSAEIDVVPEKCCSSQERQRRRKRVRFALSSSVEEDVVFWRPPMTSEEIDATWWSHLEYKIMRAEARESCSSDLQCQRLSQYMTEYIQMFNSCAGMGPTEDEKERFFQVHDDDRGLEDYYIPFLSRDRRRAVYGVLVAQKKLHVTLDPSIRDRLLSATSRHLTRSSRLLASIVGEADAQAAFLIHQRAQRLDVENPFRSPLC